MGDKQQGKPKRYRFEVAVDAALIEDALNGSLGTATTTFLSTIGLINSKGNPVDLNGEDTKIKVEKKDNKNQNKPEHKPGFVTLPGTEIDNVSSL